MQNYSEFSWLRIDDFPAGYRAALRTDDYQDYLVKARPNQHYDFKDYQVTSTTITRHLNEGDVVDLGNRALTVYHLPGHSPGSIGLWDPSGSTLFSGDALYDGELLDQLPGSSIPDYINTMKRLRELPVEAVHGGHEASFGRKRMIELIDAYLDWRTSDRAT
jgi:glyoxylase-like metal-dependent hydrolase (beta-lactamase superfamily II)